jgi:hypothetical protein
MKDIGEILSNAVALQKEQILINEKKKEQEKVDAIRYQIAYTCGHEKLIFNVA